jgi:hypothetical protein
MKQLQALRSIMQKKNQQLLSLRERLKKWVHSAAGAGVAAP